MRAGKVWGTTELLLKTPFVEMHRLKINPYSHCSLHSHQHKWNAFFVIQGELVIEVHKNDYNLRDKTVLLMGEIMEVRPNEFHSFSTGFYACECIEIYYPEPLSEDIIRKTVGGTNDADNNSSTT